jgi:hypothetical protein
VPARLGQALKLVRLEQPIVLEYGGGLGRGLDWDASCPDDTTAHSLELQTRRAWQLQAPRAGWRGVRAAAEHQQRTVSNTIHPGIGRDAVGGRRSARPIAVSAFCNELLYFFEI